MHNVHHQDRVTHLVYLLTEENARYQQALEQRHLPGLQFTQDKSQAEILLAAPPLAARCLEQFPKLKWLQSIYAGVDALMAPSLPKTYQLTNVKGIFGQQIAEYVLGYTLSFYRHFPLYQQQQTDCHWQAHSYGTLRDKVMVILGTGSIGNELAHVAKAFGLRLIGINRTGLAPSQSHFEQVYAQKNLNEVMQQADIVVNTLPSTPHTDGMLNTQTLSHAQHILLFNVGRGNVLLEQDLIPAIQAGHVQHAFLDVFCQEPLRSNHPFWSEAAITITPHIAAVSFPDQVVDIFADNYQRWQNNQPLHSVIDFTKGY